jgi:hypothetical protein
MRGNKRSGWLTLGQGDAATGGTSMLVNQFAEFRSGLRYPNGAKADEVVAPIKQRIAKSDIFLMDKDAVAMAASVSLSKPSTIVSSLPWVKLPFDVVWIEFENGHSRTAMQELGSPLLKSPGAAVTIERSGFLIRHEGDGLVFDYVHSDRTSDGRRIIDLCPVRGRFSLAVDDDVKPLSGWHSLRTGVSGAKGRVKRHLELITSDPREIAATEDLEDRFDWRSHPDMTAVREAMNSMVGPDQVAVIEENQANEMRRLFMMQILPTLILLNCKNAVETEYVEVSAKLNKNRVAKGKPPLAEYRIVKMRLTPRFERAVSENGANGAPRSTRASMVQGHFKVRKTGIYWWSPHARSGYGTPIQRITVLTR